RSAHHCAGHREYATPSGRKIDPSFAMAAFRPSVAAILADEAPPPVLIPASDAQGRPTLRRGAAGPLVGALQEKLAVTGPDFFGPRTEAAVREFQRGHGLVPDRIVGPRTWTELDQVEEAPPGPAAPPATPSLLTQDQSLAWGAKVNDEFR